MMPLRKQDRLAAIFQARKLLDEQPLFLDTETTGLNERAEIIEVSLLDLDGKVLLDSLVRPLFPIPRDAMLIHGITNEMVQGAPTWAQLWPRIQPLLQSRRVAAYNAPFDLRMMRQSHRISQLTWDFTPDLVDLLEIYSLFHGEWDSRRGSYRWISLENAGMQCHIPLPNSHRSRDDALLARALLLHMATSSI